MLNSVRILGQDYWLLDGVQEYIGGCRNELTVGASYGSSVRDA